MEAADCRRQLHCRIRVGKKRKSLANVRGVGVHSPLREIVAAYVSKRVADRSVTAANSARVAALRKAVNTAPMNSGRKPVAACWV